jgi:hypothetical protein
MKTTRNVFNPVKHLQLILLASILIFSAACDDDEDDGNENPNDIFKATLVGTSEVPPNTSAATGTATLTFNKDTKVFSIIVDFSGLEVTAGHIHKGETNVSGDVVFPFSSPLMSPVNYTSAPLTTAQENDLYDHLYYVNLHSSMYPAGEIRGQLIKQ